MKNFRVEVLLENGDVETDVNVFKDWTGRGVNHGREVGPFMTITAKDWAEDWARSIYLSFTDAITYSVTEIEPRRKKKS